MQKEKRYVNGKPYLPGEMGLAKEALVRKGIYRTLGNFGPYLPGKDQILHKLVDRFELEGFEFTIVEHEVMSFSFNSMSVSEPYMQKSAWFQKL